ncbi:MAG: glycosyltransferase [Methanomassiliicoccus sp.]|nr:glycosyltransferase [Methanomassiliicoccus sp.]
MVLLVVRPAKNSLFSIIIPTYDEVRNIDRMIIRLLELYPGVKVLVLDDNSKDGTIEAVTALEASKKDVSLVIRDPGDRGLTAAVMDGIARTTTPYYIVMDADFQHPPETLAEIMAALEGGADMVIGKREHKEALNWKRRTSSDAAQFLAHTYLRMHRQPHPDDIMSGLFGARTDMSQKIVTENGILFEKKGFKVLFDLLKFVPRDITVAEVHYQFGDRADGESKLSSTIITSILRQCGLPGKCVAYVADRVFLKRSGQVVLLTLVALMGVIMIILS